MLGGGDFNRGDTGHRGESLDNSDATETFCGTGVRSTGSEFDGGGNEGVVAEESCCRGVEGAGTVVLDLDGLGSWILFLRDPAGVGDVRLALPVLAEGRVGDVSLDCAGDAVSEVEADVHFEACESIWALEVAEVSLSIEFRLDRLASIAI